MAEAGCSDHLANPFFSAGHDVVVHVGIEKGKASGNERFHLVGIKVIAHTNFERPGNDCDVLYYRSSTG